MDIQITEKQKCDLSVKCIMGANEIASKEKEVMQMFQKAPVPGSRPGKANDAQLKQHYRQQVMEATKRALAEEAFHQTLFDKNLRPHGPPQFKSIVLLAGHFSCEFDLTTKPTFELANFKEMEVVKPHVSANENDEVQKTLQELREKYGEASPYSDTDKVETGDNVIVSFQGSIDGKDIDFLKGDNEILTVGQTGLKDFDLHLIGMSSGETKEFDFVAPAEGLASLAGKTVHFKVELLTGSKVVPMPLDDSLAKKLGKETLLELQEEVKNVCSAKIQQKQKEALSDAVSKKLCEIHELDVPEFMTKSEAKYLASAAKLNWDTLSDEDKTQYTKVATQNVKLSLILDLIRENEPEAQLSDEEVINSLKQQLAKTQDEKQAENTLQEMNKSGYLNILAARMKDTYLLDWLTNTIKISE